MHVATRRAAPVGTRATAEPAVRLRGVGKRFDGFRALQDIDIDFPRGELTTLLGPSGCGKTTTLKIVAGLIEPTEGEVLVNGRPVSGPGPERAFVFQDFALLPWATVLRNVAFGLELRGVPKPEREEIARAQIAEVGLTGAEHKYPHELSGGMRQRVAIARALAQDTRVLLMDEPFAALDAQTREIMQQELLRIWNAERKTVLFITHQIDEAIYLSDKVIVMTARPGRIKAVLDWEMSTLGDPLTDIGMMFVYWPQAGEERASTMSPVTTLPGFPTRLEVAERYAQRTGADLSDLNWYVGFAFFKFAAIIAGIVARSAAGAMAGKDTSGYAERIDPCVELGRAALDDGAI